MTSLSVVKVKGKKKKCVSVPRISTCRADVPNGKREGKGRVFLQKVMNAIWLDWIHRPGKDFYGCVSNPGRTQKKEKSHLRHPTTLPFLQTEE